jgi:hypothetical protein
MIRVSLLHNTFALSVSPAICLEDSTAKHPRVYD